MALAAGTALSVPLGIAVSRRRRLEPLVLGFAGVAQTIPGLALLALMVPLLAWVGLHLASRVGIQLPAIGFLPAVLALTLYSLLPILRNTVTALAGIDPILLEAARAVGMTPRQRLFQVELPMALPVIAAGLRTATVWVVGTATLSTPVGAPSLGNYIFGGLQTRNYDAVTVGCVAAAMLALGLDLLVRLLEIGLRRRRRSFLLVAGGILLGLFAYALVTLTAAGRESAASRPLVVGAKTFTEQYILAEILARRIQATGEPVRVTSSLGSTVAFDALAAGEIDAYVDYTGTLWSTILGDGEGADRQEILRKVRDALAERYGITVAAVLGFENAYALAMRRRQAERLGVSTIGGLVPHAPDLELGSDYEFLSRPEWRRIESAYGLRFAAERSMDPSLMYQAVATGSVDVISAFSSDGRIAAYDLLVLDDEEGVIPPYDAVVLSGPRLALRPAALAALSELAGAIGPDEMRLMNLAVDGQGRLPSEVARDFLAAELEWRGE